jgi:hypothetical protein
MSASLLTLWLLLSSAQAAPEPSVRPGANQQYLDQDLSVWKQRFETGGREIFGHQSQHRRSQRC